MKFLSWIGASLVLCAPLAQTAVVINDGTTTEGLVRLAPPPLAGSAATTTLTTTPEENLQASVSQLEFPNFPILHTTWYATAYVATGGTFAASATFVPQVASVGREGGVVGWLNEESKYGLVFALRNETSRTFCQVSVYDFSVGTPVASALHDTEGNVVNEGSPASESPMTTGYLQNSPLRLVVSFEPPTTNDLVALPAATARLSAVGMQNNGSGDVQVTTPIILLTTLAEPLSGDKLLGYYAVYRDWNDLAAPIGRLDNLTIDGEFDIGNQLPIISLTTPQADQQFATSDPINITASAVDPDGTIAQVEFFAGTETLSTATQAPYTHQWQTTDVGVHALSAVATDNRGATRTSAIVSVEVTNRPPAVSITTPTNGQSFPPGTGIPIEAVASDPDGSIAQVQFFLDGGLLSGSILPPYTTTWFAVQEGTFTLTAVATDDRGTSTTSAPVSVRIGQTSIEPAEMTVDISNGMVNVTWDRTGFQLQYALSLLGPWTDVGQNTTGVTQYSEPVSGQPKYYGLVARGVTPGQPSLEIERSGTDLTVTWDQTGYQLQESTDLTASWQDVSANTTGVRQYAAPRSSIRNFFRLRP